jgi:hypothetical protein
MLLLVFSEIYVNKIIGEDIVSRINRNSFINFELVDAKVEYGKGTLSGTEPSRYAYISAYNTARYKVGVVDVIINLTIKR